MAREISNDQDVIDSRDVIARIEELEAEREELTGILADAEELAANIAGSDGHGANGAYKADEATAMRDEAREALKEWDESEEAAELKALKALADDAEGYCDDWKHGAALIRDSYFEAYAREMAEDIGATWPNDHINWEAAADALKQDYTSADFGGVEYWVR